MSLVRSADHRYRLNDGPWVPGVTSVIRVIDKPALIPWAKGVTADAALDNLVRFTEIFHTDGRPPARGWLIGHADQERDAAADLGSRVHELTEQLDRGASPIISDLEFPYVEAYRRYLEDWKPEIKSLEQFIYNEAAGYGGTYDAIEVLTINGKKVTVCRDTKTSRGGPYIETRLQLTALMRPENVIGKPDTDKVWPVPAFAFATILHLRPELYERGYQLYRVIPSDADWHAFLGALAVYRWKQQRPSSGDPIGVTA